MKNIKRCLFLFMVCIITFAAQGSQTVVEKTYQSWCDTIAIAKGNPAPVVKFYAPHAILLPTLSSKILVNNHGEFNEYFKSFTSNKNIQCKTDKVMMQMLGDNFALLNGLYTFTFNDKNDQLVTLPARFTFVYKKYGNEWLIVSQHSSLLPK
jgi:uncharacterized protein (TIGR02246 family)